MKSHHVLFRPVHFPFYLLVAPFRLDWTTHKNMCVAAVFTALQLWMALATVQTIWFLFGQTSAFVPAIGVAPGMDLHFGNLFYTGALSIVADVLRELSLPGQLLAWLLSNIPPLSFLFHAQTEASVWGTTTSGMLMVAAYVLGLGLCVVEGLLMKPKSLNYLAKRAESTRNLERIEANPKGLPEHKHAVKAHNRYGMFSPAITRLTITALLVGETIAILLVAPSYPGVNVWLLRLMALVQAYSFEWLEKRRCELVYKGGEKNV